MIRFIPALGIALLSAQVALADHARLSADQFLQQCQEPGEQSKDFCRGYIAGIADSGGICIPHDINDATLANLVSSSLIEAGEQAAAPLIQGRLEDVFPCDKEQQSGDKKGKKGKSQNWSNKERKPG